MEIKYFTNKEIDKKKWDNCIATANNSLIYAYSFYLDNMAKNWDALVLNDYEVVMPLTWKKKYGIRYLYQPAFIQQLGIFFKDPIPTSIYEKFKEQLLRHFNFAEITFNFLNTINPSSSFVCLNRTNYILLLQPDYNTLFKKYSTIFLKNLKQVKKQQLFYKKTDQYNQSIDLYRKKYGERFVGFSKNDYESFKKICFHLHNTGQIIIRNVVNKEDQLLATAVLLRDNSRLYNIISFISTEGRRLNANYLLYDSLIKEFLEENILVDFEGSDVKSIGDFYKQMGAENQSYQFVRYNQLRPLLKLFKK